MAAASALRHRIRWRNFRRLFAGATAEYPARLATVRRRARGGDAVFVVDARLNLATRPGSGLRSQSRRELGMRNVWIVATMEVRLFLRGKTVWFIGAFMLLSSAMLV